MRVRARVLLGGAIGVALLQACLPRRDPQDYVGGGGASGAGGFPPLSEATSRPDAALPPGPTDVTAPPLLVDAGEQALLDAGAPMGVGGAPGGGGASATDAGGGVEEPSAPDAGTSPPCPPGAAELADRCLVVLTDSVAWSAGRAACQALGQGWDLAAVKDTARSAAIAEFITVEVWLGGTDQAIEGQWRWPDSSAFWNGDGATGSAPVGAYANWNGSEPNGGGNSDCMRALPRTAAAPSRNAPWADLECTQLRASLCEGPAAVSAAVP